MSTPEDLYREKFSGYAPEPPGSVWSGVERRLAWQRFLTFRPYKMNIYYAAAAICALSIAAISQLWGGSLGEPIAIIEPSAPSASLEMPLETALKPPSAISAGRISAAETTGSLLEASQSGSTEKSEALLSDTAAEPTSRAGQPRAGAPSSAQDIAPSAMCADAVRSGKPAALQQAPDAAQCAKAHADAIVRALGQTVAMEAACQDERLSYIWDFGDGKSAVGKKASHRYEHPGTYEIRLLAFSKADNISDTIVKEVTVSAPEYSVTFPNAQVASLSAEPFAPKGNVSEIASYRIAIYSRSGQEVFSSQSAQQGWNGYYKGERLPKGVYVYRASCVFSNGERCVYNGSITLLWEENANLIIHP